MSVTYTNHATDRDVPGRDKTGERLRNGIVMAVFLCAGIAGGVLLSSDPDFDGTLAMDDGEGVPPRRRGRRRGGVQEGVERVPRERQMDWWQRLEAGLGETADASEAEDDGAELDEAAERRRRRIKEWGEPRKCQPPLDRTFTFEEDMAVIKQAEEALRRA